MGVCRIIPLGGLGEVGKNMMVVEAEDAIVVIDAGLAFPRDEHLGVDLVLPDFAYLRDREHMIRAVILTHGHEDHVGALPYLMREVRIPRVYATRLTLGLVKSKLDEHGLLRSSELQEIHPDDPPRDVGPFRISFVRMAHSIPDCVAVVLETPAGRIVHTGDWKLDHTPIDGLKTDVGRLAELGNEGVALMLGDSTNAERPGMTPSERLVGEAFRQIIPLREGRILVSSFASNVHRMQQAIDVAISVGRKVCVVGGDTWPVEAVPGESADLPFACHAIWITMNGIFINENLDLEALAADKAYEFAWSFNPLPLKGATGSPGNSVAIA